MPIPDPFTSEFRIAEDSEIRSWSFGQISKTRVPNSAPLAEHVGTLTDERIFGPSIDYRCACGKYDGLEYNGIICDLCGVKIATTDARRRRFGHIKFPTKHIEHPFDSSVKMGCFPVIPAIYLESPSGRELCEYYERLLAEPFSLFQLIEYLAPMAENSIRWLTEDSDIFTRGIGLIRIEAT